MSALSLAEISSSSTPQDVSVWIPPASGAVAAVLIAVTGAIVAFNASGYKNTGFRPWLQSTVDAGHAWSLSDSWLTNVSSVGGILGAAVTAVGSSSWGSTLTLLFLIFSGTAAFAPLTYVALATQPSPDTTIEATNASAWGFLSAAVVTMTAAMGELATLALLVCQIGNSAFGKILLVAFLVIGAFLVAVYSVKTIKLFAATQPAATQPAATPAPATPTAEAQPNAVEPRILPAQPVLQFVMGNARSATL